MFCCHLHGRVVYTWLWLIYFLKKKINFVLCKEKNICSLYRHKEMSINVKTTTRTYDKNAEGC